MQISSHKLEPEPPHIEGRETFGPLLNSLQGLSGVVILFGGTFDPPHCGHIELARAALNSFSDALLVFVPTAQNPLKLNHPGANADERLEMLCAAVAGEERMKVCPAQLRREVGNYTIDLVRALKSSSPEAEAVLLIGSDCLETLPGWRAAEELLELATPLVFQRPGKVEAATILESQVLSAKAQEKLRGALHTGQLWEISSTEIRARRARGEDCVKLVPPEVNRLMIELGLYRGEQAN